MRSLEKRVPGTDDLFERSRIAAGIRVSTAPCLPMERSYHLLPVGTSRHVENVVRVAAAYRVHVIDHR